MKQLYTLSIFIFLLWPRIVQAQESFTYCQDGHCRFIQDYDLFASRILTTVAGNTYQRFREVSYTCRNQYEYALTFDDGPSRQIRKIASILRKHQVPATFFVMGSKLSSQDHIHMIRELHTDGHMIANHSLTHPSLIAISKNEALSELNQTRHLIHSALAGLDYDENNSLVYRPPFGEINEDTGQFLKDHSYHAVIWNSDRWDWNDYPRETILNRVAQHLDFNGQINPQNNSILDLNHDRMPATVEALDDMISMIKSSGYRFVTVQSCLGL